MWLIWLHFHTWNRWFRLIKSIFHRWINEACCSNDATTGLNDLKQNWMRSHFQSVILDAKRFSSVSIQCRTDESRKEHLIQISEEPTWYEKITNLSSLLTLSKSSKTTVIDKILSIILTSLMAIFPRISNACASLSRENWLRSAASTILTKTLTQNLFYETSVVSPPLVTMYNQTYHSFEASFLSILRYLFRELNQHFKWHKSMVMYTDIYIFCFFFFRNKTTELQQNQEEEKEE